MKLEVEKNDSLDQIIGNRDIKKGVVEIYFRSKIWLFV